MEGGPVYAGNGNGAAEGIRGKGGISLAQSPDDARLVQVVLRHFHFHPVADGQADETLPHLAGDGREHLVFVVQFDAEHCPRQYRRDAAFNLYMFFHTKNGCAAKQLRATPCSNVAPTDRAGD